MSNFNLCILVGRLTRDPEMRFIPSGTAVCQLGLAINRTWRDKSSGEKREETAFVDVEFWGKTAEVVTQHLSKGREILVEGRLKTDQWEDKDTGKKRSRLKVVGQSFQFIGAKPSASPRPAATRDDGGFDPDESIPF